MRQFPTCILLWGAGLVGAPTLGQAVTPIFVELKEPPPTVVARYQSAQQGQPFDEDLHRAAVRLAQDQFLQQLVASGIPYSLASTTLALPGGPLSVPDRHTDLINALRLEVAGWDVARIRKMSTVRHISVDVGTTLQLNNSVPYIRANCPHPDTTCSSARSAGLRGTGRVNPDGSSTGQVIAVLDSGIDQTNPMFDTQVDDSQFEQRLGDSRPVRLQGAPYAEGVDHPKVAYRSLFSTNAVTGDDAGHGTRVASTAAGLKARADAVLNNGEILEGVAPGALLMDYHVCPSLICFIEQVLQALEDSIRPTDVNGFPKPVATIVNMSFANPEGDPNSADGVAAGNLQFAGVFPNAANGGTGPAENTMGSPASHRLVVSTAVAHDPGVAPHSADVLQDDEAVRNTPGSPTNAGALPVEADTPKILAFLAEGSNGGLRFGQPIAQYYVDIGLGDIPDQVPVSVSGRVCLAKRGSTAVITGQFANKALQCQTRGGIALVIYNNVPGPIGVITAPSPIPVFTISGTDGLFLRDTVGFEPPGGFGAISNLPIRLNQADPGLFVPDTDVRSSRGPNNDFKVVKPDITAPGIGILAATGKVGLQGVPTGFDSGSSFAVPHVSGAAALVRDALARPGFTPSLVRAALMNGSTNLREADGTPIAPSDDNNFIHETGAGLPDVLRAVNVRAVMGTNNLNGTGGPDDATNPNFLASHSFGERGLIGTGLPATDARQRRIITVTIADVSGSAGDYHLSIIDAGALRGYITRPLDTPGFSVSLTTDSVSLGANGKAIFGVTVAVEGTATGLQIAGPDVNGDPATEFLWYVIAIRTDGSESLRMPFYLRVVQAPGPEGGKVTGGGHIPDGGSDQKANFGFNAHFEGSTPAGHITYDANNGGISLKGDVRALRVSDFSAGFSGTCTLGDGTACEYTVDVQDNAEPGNGADRFSIRVFTPGGTLLHSADALLGGGNIQVHSE